jgi:hypothetical protein
VARAFLDGWQFSGISTVSSGYPLQLANANFSISGTVNGVDVANAKAIAGTPDTSSQPFLTCDPRSGLGKDQYINPNCFAPPSPGKNGAYIFPYLKGPMYFNHDLSMFKNFVIDENKKIQFRISAFNFLNHPLKSLTSENLDIDFGPDGKVTKESAARFGFAGNNKFGHRILQLAWKFYF